MPRRAHLNNYHANKIRKRWRERPTVKSLALEYGVSVSVIQNILRGQTYREIMKANSEITLFRVEQGDECTPLSP